MTLKNNATARAADTARAYALPTKDSDVAESAPSGAWGACPNCNRLLDVQAMECPHCDAVFDTAAWQVRAQPGRVPTAAESAALAAAASRRAEMARGKEARRRKREKSEPVGSLGQQLLNTADQMVLVQVDNEAESTNQLVWTLMTALVLAVPVVALGKGVVLAVYAIIAVLLLYHLPEREAGFQRTVVMDVANTALTVDLNWPHFKKSMRRSVPVQQLRLRLDRWDSNCEGVTETNWRVVLALPDDPDDPGDASIELAVFFGQDAEAARVLCWHLVSHLGLPAQALELPAET